MNDADSSSLEDLVAEYVDARLLGEEVSLDAICARRPDLAEALRKRVETFDRLGEFVAAPNAGLRPGDVVDDFRIEETLGSGGMGTVHRATQLSLGRTVALKVGRDRSTPDPRLVREARAVARLRHPNVVSLLELVTLAGRPALVMEYVDGESLAERIARGGVDPIVDVLVAGARLADALALAHRRGIVHRDVKPANVLVGRDGAAWLADFGLAWISGDERLTLSGSELGTPAYMSPEQVDGRPLGPQTDVWSLGVTLYEWLTGRRPFEAEHRSTLYGRILGDAPASPRRHRRDLPRDVERIVERCLEKRPEDRYPDARSLALDLDAAARGAPIAGGGGRVRRGVFRALRRRRGLVAASAVIVLLALAFERSRRSGAEARVDRLAAEAELLLERARFDEAAARVDEALADGGGESPGRLRFLRGEARLRSVASDHTPMEPSLVADVLADYDAALAEGVDTAAVRSARAFLLAFLGRPEEAAEEIRRGRERPIETAADAYHRARVEAYLGEEGAALELYREAVRRDPRALVPYLQLAHLSVNVTGTVEEARNALDQCARVHPDHPAIETMRARIEVAEGDVDAGLARLRRVLERRPISRRAFEALATVLQQRGELDALEECHRRFLLEQPNDPQWTFGLAALSLLRGDAAGAREEIDALLEVHPDHTMLLAMDAVLLVLSGDTGAATRRIEEIAGRPGFPAALGVVDAYVAALPPPAEPAPRDAFLERLGELRAAGRVVVDAPP